MTLHETTIIPDDSTKRLYEIDTDAFYCRWCYEDFTSSASIVSSCEFDPRNTSMARTHSVYHPGPCYLNHLSSRRHAQECVPRITDRPAIEIPVPENPFATLIDDSPYEFPIDLR